MRLGPVAVGCWLSCAAPPPEGAEEALPEPPADREAWGAHLVLQRAGGYALHMRTAYERYYAASQITVADSGIEVVLRDAEGRSQATITAGRMVLEHGSGRAGLAAGVRVSAADSLQVEADTLVVDLEQERVWGPQGLRVESPSGHSRGKGLRAGLDFESWVLEETDSYWDTGRYRLEVQARRQESTAEVVELEGVKATVEGWVLEGSRASYRDADGLIVFGEGVVGVEGERRFRADRLHYLLHLRPDSADVEAAGRVQLEEPDLYLEAETFTEVRRQGTWSARGKPARVRRGLRVLQAAVLEYDGAADGLQARGDVVFVDDKHRLTAAGLYFDHPAEQVVAWGGVQLEGEGLEGLLRADSLGYDLAGQRLKLIGSPRLERVGETPLTVAATQMDVDLKAETLVGDGGVTATAGGWLIEARQARFEYGQDRLQLAGGVVLQQEQRRIEADSARVLLADGSLQEAVFPGPLRAVLAAADTQRSWLAAAKGHFYFATGGLERVELEGAVDAVQRRLDRPEVSRFTGGRMEVDFDEQGLFERMRVTDKAEVRTRLPQKGADGGAAGNVSRGEAIVIRFAGGRVDEVRVEGSQGDYYPPEGQQDKTPRGRKKQKDTRANGALR